jgi:hypothetical protein
MRRRAFITGVGPVVAWPTTAAAQARKRAVGILMTRDAADAEGRGRIAAFRKELQALGWADGRNLEIDERWAGTDRETIERMAKELVARNVDVIVTQNTPATAAVLKHTRTTPTVFFQAAWAEETRREMGDDWWPYGFAPNHAVLDTFLRYHHEQGVIAALPQARGAVRARDAGGVPDLA